MQSVRQTTVIQRQMGGWQCWNVMWRNILCESQFNLRYLRGWTEESRATHGLHISRLSRYCKCRQSDVKQDSLRGPQNVMMLATICSYVVRHLYTPGLFGFRLQVIIRLAYDRRGFVLFAFSMEFCGNIIFLP
jgi:hypothetical protein